MIFGLPGIQFIGLLCWRGLVLASAAMGVGIPERELPNDPGACAWTSRGESASLYWVTWVDRPSRDAGWLSMELYADGDAGWTLDVFSHPARGRSPGEHHRERLADRVQCGFPLKAPATGEGTLELRLRPAGNIPASEAAAGGWGFSLPARLLRGDCGTPPGRAVIPEVRPTSGPRRWSRWTYEARGAGPVRFFIEDVAGGVVRAWPEGWLDAGTLMVIWDGTDDAGRLTPEGQYRLRTL